MVVYLLFSVRHLFSIHCLFCMHSVLYELYSVRTVLFTENLSTSYQGSFAEDVWTAFGTDYDIPYPENIPSSAANYFSDYKPKYDAEDFFIARPKVVCKPMPGEKWCFVSRKYLIIMFI